MRKIVLDTNVLLETPEILQEDGKTYILPYTVLKELDDLKRKRYELGYAVRVAARTIMANRDHIIFDFEGSEAEGSFNDEKIIGAATRNQAELYTEDLLMTLLAQSRGVETYNPSSDEEKEEYNGYIELHVTEDMEDLIQTYYGRPAITTKGFDKEVLNKYLPRLPYHNEYVMVYWGDNYLIFKFDAESDYYVKMNYKSRKVKINGSGAELEPLDSYQHAALTSACDMNVPLTVIDGPVGSGKTILALAAALHLKYAHQLNTVYITRPPIGVDSRYDIGFLPGSREEKLNPWIGGIISNLEFLYPRGAEEVFKENFQHFAVNTAQGYSIHNSVLIVDECQLLSIDVLKQILSRVSAGSKLILLGDEAQTYKVVPRAEMGFRRLKHLFPLEDAEYIKLQKIYRGKLAELSVLL